MSTNHLEMIKSKPLLLLTIILMDLLAGTEFDLFMPSFPELKTHFNLTPAWVEALLSANFVGYCLSLFMVGGLADRYGRKPIILVGLALFMIGSILCLYEVTYGVMLLGRFLQGVGIAAPAILSFLIIADHYPLKKQQFYMAMLNGVMNISVAIAPVFGSYIALYFHWQGNFIALLLLALLTFIMTLLFIPAYQLPKEGGELSSLQGYLSLLKSKPLLLLMANIILMFMPYWIFVGMSPLLYIHDLGVSLAYFGYYQGILALVFAVGSILFGLMIHCCNQKIWLRIASGVYFVGLMALLSATWQNTINPLLITLAFIPFIISQIIPSNLLFPFCLNFIPQAKAKISAVLQGSRLLFAAISLEVAGYCYAGSFQSIGIVVCIYVLLALMTHFLVMANAALMTKLGE